MAKEGGIGFGTIVMGIIVWNVLFGGDDDVFETKVEIIEDERPAVMEQLKESVGSLKPEVDALISSAKDELVKLKAGIEIRIEEKLEEEKPEDEIVNDYPQATESNDRFGNDDLYGSIEDKW